MRIINSINITTISKSYLKILIKRKKRRCIYGDAMKFSIFDHYNLSAFIVTDNTCPWSFYVTDLLNNNLKMNKDYHYISNSEQCSNKPRKQQVQQTACDISHKIDASQFIMQNRRERQMISYLKEKRIREIIDFLMSNLLLHRPYDPFEYLIQLLDRCILFNSGLVDSPQPFTLQDIINWAKQVNLNNLSNFTTDDE